MSTSTNITTVEAEEHGVPTTTQRNTDGKAHSLEMPATSKPVTSKDIILDAAKNLLARHGYTGLSMRELAAESGLAKATLYHHFQDKDELFRSVLERDMAMVNAQLLTAAENATGAIAKITAVIRLYASLMRERRTVIMSVLRELSKEKKEKGDLYTLIHSCRSQYFTPITTILAEGIDEGVFRPLNIEQTAISMVGMINAFMLFNCNEKSTTPCELSESDEQFIDHTVQLFLFGISHSK